ncbi:MAG: RluA family pseudouridine synthase [Parachlamydiales bacterium]|jgi:tRNA pseudouridine32 synthase/23S rRNA pseudouridine746 synthase/23S rRNA pseudouridine1911/1915/1917 synthase
MKEKITLLDALIIKFPDCTKTTVRDWIKQGRIAVDKTVVKIPSQEVDSGQDISLLPPRRKIDDAILPTCRIIFEDPHIVVVEKKSGSLSVETDKSSLSSVHSDLKQRYHPNKVFVVHRLDQGTSGLMVFARTQTAFTHLKGQLEKRSMHREYIAIVKGKPKEPVGTWHTRVFEDKNFHVHVIQNPNEGEEAITHYETLAYRNPYTVIRAKLETGKKNQIRVHCQHAGIPIVGDDRYGGDMGSTKRLLLHAYTLELDHPINRKKLVFYSPIPRVFPYFVPAKQWILPPMTLEPIA